MNNSQIIQQILEMKTQIASITGDIAWLKWLVLGLFGTGILGAWDNHKLKKAQIKFFQGGK